MSPTARRILGLVVVALVVAVGSTFAGRWQWQRADAREHEVTTLRANFAAEPVPLDEILASPTSPVTDDVAWRLVELKGRYAPSSTVLLRNRPVDGTPAFHVLEPFVVEEPGSPFDGAVLVVDRGWFQVGTDPTGAGQAPAPPAGTVTIEVRLRPAERPESREAPAGQAYTIFPAQVLEAAGGSPGGVVVEQAYGALAAEIPAPAEAPEALPVPSTDLGPHRSYALQWWFFAVGALGGFGMLAVREARTAREEAAAAAGPEHPAPPKPEPRPARTRRRPSAEEEEDALIDAQLGAPQLGVPPQASETSSR